MARKKWSAEEKQKIVSTCAVLPVRARTQTGGTADRLAGLRNEASIAELCRRHGVSDVMYYKWKKAFLEGALSGLKGNGTASSNESALKRENEELKALVGELTVENRFLKRIQGS